MKKFLSVITIICLIISLFGCAKLVNIEYQEVEVTITDEYYRGMYVTPMRVGKVTTMQTHPAVYRITVEYNGIEYTISGSDTYNKYKDKVGEIAIGTLEIRTYVDGTVRHNITELQ